jgi:murein hydrolase activator
MATNRWIKTLLFIILLIPATVVAQKQSEKLEKQKRELEEKIRNTKDLISGVKNTTRITIAELVIINQQITYREELIQNISSQVRRLNQQIEDNRSIIESLSEDLVRLKAQYSKMIFYAYKHRNTYHKLLFVFAARDFNTAFLRVKYLKQFGDSRKRQVELINGTQIELERRNADLGEKKKEKEVLAEEQNKEKANYAKDKESQQQVLGKLQQEEKKLKQQLDEQEEKKRLLAKQIQKALQEEIRKQQEEERKRREEEERKRKAAQGTGNDVAKNNEKNTTTTTTKTNPKNEKNFEGITPEGDPASTNFENNKGKLPWPVERGEIILGFGNIPHPTMAGIMLSNNGIDIGTPKKAKVRSVFDGTVTSILVISGQGKVVIISHGAYRTVYANLGEVYVNKGDKVKIKQDIGSLLSEEDSKISEAHFEIWKITESDMLKQDPTHWLVKK